MIISFILHVLCIMCLRMTFQMREWRMRDFQHGFKYRIQKHWISCCSFRVTKWGFCITKSTVDIVETCFAKRNQQNVRVTKSSSGSRNCWILLFESYDSDITHLRVICFNLMCFISITSHHYYMYMLLVIISTINTSAYNYTISN